MNHSKSARMIEIITPKKWILNGLWLGPMKPKRVYIFVHGLASSIFSESVKHLSTELVSSSEAVLVFNNRGHDPVSKLYGLAPRSKKGYKSVLAGAAYEVFTECVDDLEGAVLFAERAGVKEIVLVGHSTGCQKSIYWASKKSAAHRSVRAVVLLAPVSDYAAYMMEVGERVLQKAEKIARALVKRGMGSELLPLSAWPSIVSAQRFLSLATKESVEEIFLYAQEDRTPKTLQKVMQPILVLWAGEEEYADRPTAAILTWFERHLRAPYLVRQIDGVPHSFSGGEARVAKAVRSFMKDATL